MSGLSSYLRRIWRASLSAESLLTLDELLEALPGRPEQTKPWALANLPPAGEVAGEAVWRWADVVAIATAPSKLTSPTLVAAPSERWMSTAEAARVLGIDRGTLDAMVSRTPRDLPGGPGHVGDGRARRHLRWDATRLHEWADAVRSWERTRGRRG